MRTHSCLYLLQAHHLLRWSIGFAKLAIDCVVIFLPLLPTLKVWNGPPRCYTPKTCVGLEVRYITWFLVFFVACSGGFHTRFGWTTRDPSKGIRRWLLTSVSKLFLVYRIGNLRRLAREVKIFPNWFLRCSTTLSTAECVVVKRIIGLLKLVTKAVICILKI